MLLEGKALQVICLTTTGALTAVIIGSALTPIFFVFLEQYSEQILYSTPFVLILSLVVLINSEGNTKKKLLALFVVIAAATQGFLFKDQIFPLITGYFGVAGTLYSLKEKTFSIKQETEATINPKIILDALVGIIGGAIVSIMPGIGSNTAGGIINAFRKTKNSEQYLAMLGAINASNFFFSYTMLFTLGKSRNGTMLALSDKIFQTPEMLTSGTIIMLLSAGIGGIATISLSKIAVKLIEEKITKKLSIGAIIFMILLVALFGGPIGLIALFFSTALGLFVLTNQIKRSLCMASLIVPVLFFYLFILL